MMWRRILSVTVSGERRIRRRNCLSFRALCTLKTDHAYGILKSPSLVSLDVPDLWDSSSVHSDFHSVQAPSNREKAKRIDGLLIAEEIRYKLAVEVSRLKGSTGKVPGLGVVLVGQRRDSLVYVHNKKAACQEVGIKFVLTELAEDCTEYDILNALTGFNKDSSIHGILVQLPLPPHFDEGRILDAIKLEKDVDGVHPFNIGDLAMHGREPLFIPCTPKGCIELLLRSDVEIMGKNAVVIGRSNIVGLPASLLLQRHHATVSILHPFTKKPKEIAREADILVVAAGVPNLVNGSWIKPGAVVIDVGTNPIDDPSSENGYRIMGDVCYEEAVKVASAVSPVPGGVGPMTVAMLLYNTLESAKRALNVI